MKILEKKNVQINFTESLLRMAADDVEGEPPCLTAPSRTGVGVYRSCSALAETHSRAAIGRLQGKDVWACRRARYRLIDTCSYYATKINERAFPRKELLKSNSFAG